MSKRATKEDIQMGRRLRALRIKHNLSQTELGDALGVTFQQIQKYEKGSNRIAVGRLHQIAEKFEMTPAELLNGSTNESEPFMQMVDSRGAYQMLEAYNKLSTEQRHLLLKFVQSIT